MENDQDYSMKQLDLFGNCEPEDAGYALRWQKMSVDCSPQMMVSHLQGASESYSTAGLVKQDGASRQPVFRCGPKTEARVHCLRFWRRIR